MMPSRPPQSTDTAATSSNNPSATTARSFTAFLVPPPPTMTFVVQLGNGVQLELAPPPLVFLTPQSLDGNDATNTNSDAMLRAMHELFMRSQNAPTGPPPTSKSFLDALPQKTWDAATCANDKHTDCAICLSEYEQADDVLTLPCSHAFHRECSLRWLVDHNVCPTCRYELPTQDAADKRATSATLEVVPTPSTAATDANNARERPAADGSDNTTERNEPEAEHEPMLARMLRSLLGVRRERSPTFAEPQQSVRAVRQRVASSVDNSDDTAASLSGAVSADAVIASAATADNTSSTNDNSDAALERLLEDEATRFVAEESAKHATAAVQMIDADAAMFDDVDIDELLRDTRTVDMSNSSSSSNSAGAS